MVVSPWQEAQEDTRMAITSDCTDIGRFSRHGGGDRLACLAVFSCSRDFEAQDPVAASPSSPHDLCASCSDTQAWTVLASLLFPSRPQCARNDL